MLTATAALGELKRLGNSADAKFAQHYFKTGPGEYGEGDVFLGIRATPLRKLAAKYRELPLNELQRLLRAREHEARLAALVVLTLQYPRADEATQQKIFDFYLANTKHINNWDLVDVSAPKVVGAHLFGGSTRILDDLARSKDLWERRIAIIATQYFIKHDDFRPTLRIATRLVNDQHDLIHKAVGWMLREVGDRDRDVEEEFLRRHYKRMPRTMLRYAIEKFPAGLRATYMGK
jgi:3-methyladenine DNA glycosylase AlkD